MCVCLCFRFILQSKEEINNQLMDKQKTADEKIKELEVQIHTVIHNKTRDSPAVCVCRCVSGLTVCPVISSRRNCTLNAASKKQKTTSERCCCPEEHSDKPSTINNTLLVTHLYTHRSSVIKYYEDIHTHIHVNSCVC